MKTRIYTDGRGRNERCECEDETQRSRPETTEILRQAQDDNFTARPIRSGGQLQEVGQNLFPTFRQNGFGVELDAPDGVLFVTDAHDLAFGFGFGGDLEGVRDGVALDEQRVVARG